MSNHKMWQRFTQVFRGVTIKKRAVITRKSHEVSRKQISPHALKVLYRLNQEGYAGYLVGGSVRDLLLKLTPKDFDIATDARPEQIRAIFRNSRIIGRRFRLVHVYFYHENLEVSTFRAAVNDFTAEENEEKIYGTIEEDAWRRDFTINALYYNIANFSIEDYTGGIKDLKKKLIRIIGDPVQRYHEDPVRLLRAVRLAAKLGFNIEKNTEKPLTELVNLLAHIPAARLYDEVLKLFFDGHAESTYRKLSSYGMMAVLFPQTIHALKSSSAHTYENFVLISMRTTDYRLRNNKSLNPGFLFAILLWPALQEQLFEYPKNKMFFLTLHHCINETITRQRKSVMVPRRMASMIRSIWVMQYHLLKRRPKRVSRILKHRYFRAALDFMELRLQSGEHDLEEIVMWWKQHV